MLDGIASQSHALDMAPATPGTGTKFSYFRSTALPRSPPGRARVAANPALTGSPALIITMGRPGAPSRAARIAVVPNVRINVLGVP